jgi:hypothetical protein
VWASYADASQTLSYRAHSEFRVPAGKNWHHIIEQNQGGPNSVDNLGLVDARLNQVDFNRWFESPKPGTQGMPARDWLRGQGMDVQKEWGLKCIAAFGLTVRMRDEGRGQFQEIS